MPIQLSLPPELEGRLCREAERQGLSPAAVALQLLDRHLPLQDRRAATVAMLQSWIDTDDADADEADYDLFRAIDEARTSDRKLFPEELRGVSW